MTTVKRQVWFQCPEVACDPYPIAAAIDLLADDPLVKCDCGAECVPADPPRYEDGFSRQIMSEFEQARRAGVCNMFDRACVWHYAVQAGLHNLATVASSSPNYGALLADYSVLMRHYRLEVD